MRRTVLAALAVLVLTTACQTAQSKPASPTAAAGPVLDLRLDPLMDLHYWVRKLSVERGELPAVEGLSGAVAATRKAGAALGDSGRWGVLVGSFTEASTADELARVASKVPKTFTMRDGKTVELRRNLADLAAAYAPLEKSFLAEVWPRHREIAERAAAALRKELLPRAPDVFADLSRHLGVPAPRAPIPVYLVATAPFPGASTMLDDKGPFCVVAMEGEPDSQWIEIVVHESIHALDVWAGEDSVLAELRRRLAQIPGASPRETHDFVHTVMFVQAAGTVRSVLDAGHLDYGGVKGYYARAGRAAKVVVPAWREYLEGKIDREAALERIAAEFAAGLEKETGGP